MVGPFASIHRCEESLPIQGIWTRNRARPARVSLGEKTKSCYQPYRLFSWRDFSRRFLSRKTVSQWAVDSDCCSAAALRLSLCIFPLEWRGQVLEGGRLLSDPSRSGTRRRRREGKAKGRRCIRGIIGMWNSCPTAGCSAVTCVTMYLLLTYCSSPNGPMQLPRTYRNTPSVRMDDAARPIQNRTS